MRQTAMKQNRKDVMAEQATQTAQIQQPPSTMTEAAFSLNVKMLDKFGQEVMLTFRCPMVNQAEKLISHYENVVNHLLDGGWQPSKSFARPVATEPANGGTAPTCRVHGAPMKPSRKPGSFYCSKKLANGEYCSEKVEQG